ncbi:MAG: hypothetical protein VX475_02475, partial [Myxococcota bacterium]|nr:hypothetical protein [Myxococcota bacterium]
MSREPRGTSPSPALISRVVMLVALGWVLPVHASEDAASEVTLEEVLESVRATHPKVEASRAKVAKAQSKRQQAMGAFDLTLGSGASYSTSDSKHYGLFDITLAQPTTF